MRAYQGIIVEDNKFFVEYRPLGTANNLRIEVSKEDAAAVYSWNRSGISIQEALPHWSADKRELLLSGIGNEEWDELFSDEEDTDEEEPAF